MGSRGIHPSGGEEGRLGEGVGALPGEIGLPGIKRTSENGAGAPESLGRFHPKRRWPEGP